MLDDFPGRCGRAACSATRPGPLIKSGRPIGISTATIFGVLGPSIRSAKLLATHRCAGDRPSRSTKTASQPPLQPSTPATHLPGIFNRALDDIELPDRKSVV